MFLLDLAHSLRNLNADLLASLIKCEANAARL